jgi:arylsulfatase A-like enzyme
VTGRRCVAAGIALFLVVLGSTACGGRGGAAPRPRGAILILLDTLRADRLGAYGHGRATSPALDGLAERGVLFEQTVSYTSWTLPSVVAMLSGRFPTRKDFDEELEHSLVERLQAAGLRTAAFTDGGFLSRYYGFDLGFDSYREQSTDHRLGLREPLQELVVGGIEATFPAAEVWLRENADRPFFLLIHTLEVHVPYRRTVFAEDLPRGALDPTFEVDDVQRINRGELTLGETEYAYLGALYDGGVLKADGYVGRLLGLLEELGIADSTLLVVTSDHGEDLEGRFPRFAGDHGHSLFDELVRVPLIVYDPTRESPVKRVRQQVRTIDVLPTILDLLGVPGEVDADGRSLVPLMTGAEQGDRVAFAHLKLHGPERVALRFDGFKLIRRFPPEGAAPPDTRVASRVSFFDLRRDPGELRNVARERPKRRRQVSARLDPILERIAEEGQPSYPKIDEVPPALRERLEALGYAQ